MLILTRRISENLCIVHPDGTFIKLNIAGIKGNQVRIGIDAPKDIQVHREEIFHRILDQNSGHLPGTEFYDFEPNQEEIVCEEAA